MRQAVRSEAARRELVRGSGRCAVGTRSNLLTFTVKSLHRNLRLDLPKALDTLTGYTMVDQL